MSAIVCQGLVKRYGSFVALNGLDLSVPQGAVFGFLGPNGAGKTTTVRLLTGLAGATSGSASVAGVPVRQGSAELQRRIGYLDQQPQLYGWMRGRELLHFVGELAGLRGAELRRQADALLERTGLSAAANRLVGGYSGGMRQRLGLAQALIGAPEVLFLDEPVSALDPAGRRDVLELIAELRGQTTVFMSTHILGDVERICDTVAIIDKGRLLAEGSVDELQARYARPIFVLDPEPDQAQQVAALERTLEAQPWSSAVQREHGQLRVFSSDPAAASAALLPMVADHGVRLVRFERSRPSLEDVFLQIINEQQVQAEVLV